MVQANGHPTDQPKLVCCKEKAAFINRVSFTQEKSELKKFKKKMPKNYTYPTQNLCVYVKKLVNGESKGMKCIHNATDEKKKKKINNIRLKRTTEKTDRKKTKKNNRQYTNSTQNTLTIGLDEIPSHHIETICLKTNAQRHRKFNKREEEKEEVEEAATTKK